MRTLCSKLTKSSSLMITLRRRNRNSAMDIRLTVYPKDMASIEQRQRQGKVQKAKENQNLSMTVAFALHSLMIHMHSWLVCYSIANARSICVDISFPCTPICSSQDSCLQWMLRITFEPMIKYPFVKALSWKRSVRTATPW